MVVNIIEDCVCQQRSNLMVEMTLGNESNKFTSDGTYIAYGMVGNWKKVCKKVLARDFK